MGNFYLGIARTNFSQVGTRIVPDRMKNQAKYREISPNDLQEMGKRGEYALIPPINDTLGFGMDLLCKAFYVDKPGPYAPTYVPTTQRSTANFCSTFSYCTLSTLRLVKP